VTTFELRADSVGVDIGSRVIFSDVTLQVSSGEMLVITGASGSGKTTLVHALAGVTEPDHGAITVDGRALSSLAVAERPSLVPQDFGLVPVLTATETIALPLQARGLAKDEIRERVSRWIVALGLESCATRTVAELSGGQRQRVAIARALAMDAGVIIMDEPTAELDPVNRALVLSLLSAERGRGTALVMVSHETDAIAQASRVVELSTSSS
jgi:putative ABC transport system ATP-binding protein